MELHVKITIIVQIVIAILTLSSILVVIRQLRAIKKQTEKDHERSRRETVLSLQRLWLEFCNNSKPRIIRKLLDVMSEDSCRKCWQHQEIIFSKESEGFICQLLELEPDDLNRNKNGSIIINDGHLLSFRTYLANYLNLLEVIFTAWIDNIGDKEMIEREFGKNISSASGSFPLELIVNTSDAFPSIRAFTESLREEYKKQNNITPKKAL